MSRSPDLRSKLPTCLPIVLLLLNVIACGDDSGSAAPVADAAVDRDVVDVSSVDGGPKPDVPADAPITDTPDASRDAEPDTVASCTSKMRRVDAAPPDAGVCPDGWYQWNDQGGDTSGAGYGDGQCYQRCSKDTDCHDPQRPSCTILGLFIRGDYNCNAGVLVCRCGADECPLLRNDPTRLR
jgi:hypothetical protein